MSLSSVVRRVDSWVNALTGLGTLRDKLMHAEAVPGMRLSDGVLEALFNDDDLAARIVSKIPREATRRGFSLELEGLTDEDSSDISRELMRKLEQLGAMPKLREAWIWGRLYGGGAVFLGADDGAEPALPLNESAVRTIRFLNVLKRPQLTVRRRYSEVQDPLYGEPELYEVNQHLGGGFATKPTGVLIHASRLIVFRGALTARTYGKGVEEWDDSVLQRVHDALRRSATAWQSTAHLISDASQGVLKIANLVDLIATGGQEALRTRIEMMDMARSVCRAILVDAEREDFQRVPTSFAGLPEMMDRFMMRDAAAAEMPVTILYGRSPAGLNATGESDIRGWYDTVSDAQTDVLKPRLERLLQVLMMAQDSPTGRKVPERWAIKFNPLWQPTEAESANVLKTKAETHVALVNAQIMLAEESALELARDFPTIDPEVRQRILEAELEAREEHAGEMPDLPVEEPDETFEA